MRRIAGMLTAILLLIASGRAPGAFAAPRPIFMPGDLLELDLDEAEAVVDYTPPVNGVYGVYLLGEAEAEGSLWQDDQLVAEGDGSLCLFTARLSAGGVYTLRLSGTGRARLEIARETLSRCFDLPIALDGPYTKLIARDGDVHWYRLSGRGALALSVTPERRTMPLSAQLYDAQGNLLVNSVALPSGGCALSLEQTEDAFLRIRAVTSEVGQYTVDLKRAASSPAPESVSLDHETLEMRGRTTASIALTEPGPLTLWDSSDANVASVKNGAVESRLPGEATLTAYVYGGARATCRVSVAEVAAEGVRLDARQAQIAVGDELVLSPTVFPDNATEQGVTFASDNPAVASVDADGRVEALAEGTARIVAIAVDGDATDVLSLEVGPAPRRYRALLVGQQEYDPAVDEVRPGSLASVENLRKALEASDPGYAVTTMMDVRRDEVLAGVAAAFEDARDEDVSLVYLTCHGFYRMGMTFFVMADGSALSAADLERALRPIPGEVVLLADCCGSGGLIGQVSDAEGLLEGVDRIFQGPTGDAGLTLTRYHVLTSALADQDSYRVQFDGEGTGGVTVFARALCDGLGWSVEDAVAGDPGADADGDGSVTLDELRDYVARRTAWYLNLAGDYVQTVRATPEGDPLAIFFRSP